MARKFRKKFTVFVCSTFLDLEPQRKDIFNLLYQLGCIPIGMEGFVPANTGQMQYIRERIDECDYFIVIVAHRYGTIAPGQDISITEYEYQYAKNHPNDPKPISRFVIDPEAKWKGGEKYRCAGERLEKLELFKKRLTGWSETDFYDVNYWSEDDLLKKISASVTAMINSTERPGLAIPTPISDDALKLGIERLYPGLRQVDKSDIFLKCRQKIRIILNDGYNFLDGNAKLIERALSQGKGIDVLFVHPDSPCLPAIAEKSVKSLELQRKDILKGIAYLQQNFSGTPLLRARLHKQYNAYSAFMNEDFCLADFYFNYNLTERRQDDRIGIRCEPSEGDQSLFKKISDDFEHFWRSLDIDVSADALGFDLATYKPPS